MNRHKKAHGWPVECVLGLAGLGEPHDPADGLPVDIEDAPRLNELLTALTAAGRAAR
jgi:hypothetical protein